jgi:hypothetical protein
VCVCVCVCVCVSRKVVERGLAHGAWAGAVLDAAIYQRHQHHCNANAVSAGEEVTLQALAQGSGGGGGDAVFERLGVQDAREHALKVMHAADEQVEAMLLLAEVHSLPAHHTPAPATSVLIQ